MEPELSLPQSLSHGAGLSLQSDDDDDDDGGSGRGGHGAIGFILVDEGPLFLRVSLLYLTV